MKGEEMKRLKVISIVLALTLSLLASGMAFADRSSGRGGYKGGHSRGGGYKGSYYHGGGHKGGYYRGGHKHSYYRSGVDVVIGGPFWGPPWYYPSYYYPYYTYYPPFYPYYYPPAVEVPSSPQIYIERSRPEPSRPESSTPSGVWFYCPDSKTYYPYVKECSGGWQTVPAEPPSEKGR